MSRPDLRSLAVALFSLALPLTANAQDRPTTQPSTVRIGTFDSRIVALAYRNSAAGRADSRAVHQDLVEAQQARDDTRIKRMQLLGPSRQHLAHQQVFSNGSIVDIFPRFREALPQIAARRGVIAVVSKWELPYAAAGVETVDVTDDIVELFSPDARTRKWIDGARKAEPVPLQDLVYDPAH